MGNDMYLLTYHPGLDKDVCTEHELDYFKLRNYLNSKERKREYNNLSSIATVSALNFFSFFFYFNMFLFIYINYLYKKKKRKKKGHSRIFMARVIIYILKNGGKFKLEYDVLEAYFLAEKFYALKTTELDEKGNHKIVIRTKGLSRSSVN
ncbi:hypothetical protein BPOR_1835g00020 [Botrytis porri]|uniref:Uncharacterized protein n=1 Tax=Botrytis porri TaxID=87229 RepID=A0A4Z1K2D9_9HELO|nr:hypothetical protein BPOR_1835g00020 [Botrytis porri]